MLERRAARGEPTPALQARPQLWPSLQWIWEAFTRLSRARVVGWVPHPIALAEIEAYCRLYGITDPDVRSEFAHLVWALDQVWLAWAAEQATRHPPPAPQPPARQRRR